MTDSPPMARKYRRPDVEVRGDQPPAEGQHDEQEERGDEDHEGGRAEHRAVRGSRE